MADLMMIGQYLESEARRAWEADKIRQYTATQVRNWDFEGELEEQRLKEISDRTNAMNAAREILSVGELIQNLESGIGDVYLRGAYYCRIVELQPTLSPVGRLITERYIEKFREAVSE